MVDKFDEAIREIIEVGGRPHLVGGTVRDKLLGVKSKDLDIEVFGLTVDELFSALSKVGVPNVDDGKFGVIRLDCGLEEVVEFALPRKDNQGKRGFGGVYPNLNMREAALRRDFTFNALSQNLITGEIIDPLNGRLDMERSIIRHCDDTFFGEDPLRVVRGFRFAGQLNAIVASETKLLIRSLIPAVRKLTGSALWSEFKKWAERSVKPSKGLRFMVDTGLIENFPEIKALVGCPQNPQWHPEGDVFEHTCHVLDAATGQGVVVVLAALCHDFGKPITTTRNEVGHWVSPGHATAGEAPARRFLARIGAPKKVTEQVIELVREHMVHVGSGEISKRQARRMLARLNHTSTDDLFSVIKADHSGRPPLPIGLPDRAVELKIQCEKVEGEVQQLVLGRHLIQEGLQPGRHFGPILNQAMEAQLDGLFQTPGEGIAFLKGAGVI